jgi:hypothetical protein
MLLSIVGQTLAVGTDKPLVNDALVFEEAGGQLVVEAEAFFAQTNTEKRAWYITTEVLRPDVGRDIDPPHFADAAGGAHIEVLPDTGNDPVGPVAGESISDQAGAMAVVSYHVHFNNPGRYYIWVRALGTDGDDNTLHFGMDGEWPTNSARMHHGGGGQWGWACRHRQHKGKLWLDVPGAGPRVIQLSMREDGCEVDRFILTTNETFTAPDGIGPTVRLRSGVLPDFSSARPSVAPAPGGIRVEAESAFADGWELATARPGFSGTGYLRWTASGQGRKPGEGVLTYSFRITEPGDYQFLWRSALPDPANRPETPDPDGNDSWVRFTSGADVPGQRALGNEWRKVALLGHPEGWSWSTHADQGPPHPPTPVCRAYEPGEHRVEICGRSAGHAVDQIALRRFRDVPLTDTPGETLP